MNFRGYLDAPNISSEKSFLLKKDGFACLFSEKEKLQFSPLGGRNDFKDFWNVFLV